MSDPLDHILDRETAPKEVFKPSKLKFVELTLSCLALLAIVLSLFLVPGAGALTVLSLSSLSLFYFFLSFAFFNGIPFRKIFRRTSYEGISTRRIVGAVCAGIALSMCVTGILYKVQFWPNSHTMIRSSLILAAIVFAIGTVPYAKTQSSYYIRPFKRAAVLGTIGLLLLLLPRNTWVELKYRNHPAYIKAFNDYNNHPTPEGLEKLKDEREKAQGTDD